MEIKTVTVRGINYKIRKLQNSAWYDLKDKSKLPNGNLSELMLYRNMLQRIVISPKKNINDFDAISEIEELMTELIKYQQEEPKKEEAKKLMSDIAKLLVENLENLERVGVK